MRGRGLQVHPALRARKLKMPPALDNKTDVSKHPAWRILPHDHKFFLEMIPMYRSRTQCSVALGKDQRWCEVQVRNYPQFGEMVKIRETQTGTIPGFTEVLRGEIVMRLLRTLRGEDDKLALKAAEMLEKAYARQERNLRRPDRDPLGDHPTLHTNEDPGNGEWETQEAPELRLG